MTCSEYSLTLRWELVGDCTERVENGIPEETVAELQVGERREVVVACDDGFDVPARVCTICVELG